MSDDFFGEILAEHGIGDLLDEQPAPTAPEFTPDPDLDQLFKQAQAAAREHGWECPTREEFERAYRSEMAGKVQQ